MIDRCFNPVCKRKLDYLRDGRVVRVTQAKGDVVTVEHFWLCGPCYENHDFEFPVDGSVQIRERAGSRHREEFYFHDVVVPERRKIKRIA